MDTTVQRIWIFFKMKNTDPLMGAKLKSKTHLLNTFFDFLSRFLRVWLQSLKKVLIWPKKKFLGKNQKRCQKNPEFHAHFESVEKVVEKYTKKVIRNTIDEHE